MRLVFIQAGDFADAHEKLSQGDAESSHSQKYSMAYVTELKSRVEHLSVICTTNPYDYRELDSGVGVAGVQYFSGKEGRYRHPEALVSAIAARNPTHVLARQPIPEIYRWCTDNNVGCLPLWADSYSSRFREFRFRLRLRRALSQSNVKWVANHQIDASRSLKILGLSEDVLVPWDWPQQEHKGVEFDPKKKPQTPNEISICYAGRIEIHKGAGDLIRAVQLLNKQNIRVKLSMYGDGEDLDDCRRRVQSLNLDDQISLPGRIPVSEVVERMHDHDVVVVASRHYSNEGMPNTIRQAIRSRSPLVVSDHPAFSSIVEHEKNSVVFKASRPASLAKAILRLESDGELYERLSRVELSDLISGVPDWHEVIEHWLNGDEQWLGQYSLTALDRKSRRDSKK